MAIATTLQKSFRIWESSTYTSKPRNVSSTRRRSNSSDTISVNMAFLWTSVRRFVRGCQYCTTLKNLLYLLSGKLLPLPIPSRPWSHLSIDFITDLPSSNGNYCILIIVDHFSKSCWLIPLKQGSPTLFLESYHPEDFSSNPAPTHLNQLIKVFRATS